MKNFKKLLFALLSLAMVTNFLACDPEPLEDDGSNPNPNDSEFSLGWNADNENLSEIPSDINLGSLGNGTLPSKVDLTQSFPPIGDQGAYGTCVAWAVGYNLKTAIEAMDKGFKTGDLNASRQFSPKDLFWSISSADKGADCNGTYFEPALDVLLNRGIATMQTVPYDGLGDCSGSSSSWSGEAANYKIANYRKVDLNINELKGYIADNRPLAIGCKLGDNFMQWDSDDVLTAHSSFANVGQHANHAMALVGYDDNKGPNGAFRIINSWGNRWGDTGSIWVDYNFFVGGDFCFGAFVASNKASEIDPNNPVDPTVSGSVDLIPWNVWDNDNQSDFDTRSRYVEYNVYNIGDETVRASSNWNISYLYYNAFNANDYGILLYDLYTNQIGSPGQNGPLQSGGYGIAGNWWNNVDIPSYSGVAEEVVGQDYFTWDYYMPGITGFYYLVLIADAFDNISELDEANNLYFLSDEYGDPLYFQDGQLIGLVAEEIDDRSQALPAQGQKLIAPHQRSKANANAYTPAEIKNMILHKKETGELDAKVREFVQEKQSKKIK
ncbi:MAG TPA: C1 family peptidase [Saprospiraceae bacterium]|nr:C1 family peptidase [Saprospiraceae bacterium]HMQ81307.1 C1 family peptidase [Saprospiraceae bacterium]